MSYDDRRNFLRAERAWLTPPEPDEFIERLMDEREMTYDEAVDYAEGLEEEAAERRAEERHDHWANDWEE